MTAHVLDITRGIEGTYTVIKPAANTHKSFSVVPKWRAKRIENPASYSVVYHKMTHYNSAASRRIPIAAAAASELGAMQLQLPLQHRYRPTSGAGMAGRGVGHSAEFNYNQIATATRRLQG